MAVLARNQKETCPVSFFMLHPSPGFSLPRECRPNHDLSSTKFRSYQNKPDNAQIRPLLIHPSSFYFFLLHTRYTSFASSIPHSFPRSLPPSLLPSLLKGEIPSPQFPPRVFSGQPQQRYQQACPSYKSEKREWSEYCSCLPLLRWRPPEGEGNDGGREDRGMRH